MSDTIGVSAIGNTIPTPPRLRGDPTADLQAMNAWVGDLHRTLAREANVVGTQRTILAVLNDLIARVAALEAAATALNAGLANLTARVDADAQAFDAVANMPGSVSGTYVGAELAAAYDKINAMLAILRSP